ncbi:D111/G-patch domain-containing protein [Cavenderia fasciculata]|uniref:D111/G-patch domain-containing protein n=1 Tax=Cavenderia fasciculata TaxID=261658 RepID=F4QBZ2_CACFS|nr:D111/G-patch domain-containing protein [Cavenderia fasciculata]EGG14730.1 D111/G-patch domain-containing protein [Cavenderia fasciculata]|eukprot:XP_004351238.1 D111/G-patch domain-containing protein [Cavenderia fasciculata]
MSFNDYNSDDDDDDGSGGGHGYYDKNGKIGGDNKRRYQRKQTKDDNIYGVFGNDYDDYDEDGDKKMDNADDDGGGGGKQSSAANYNAQKPIYNPYKSSSTRFVPSGIYDPNTAMRSTDDQVDGSSSTTSTTTTTKKTKKKRNGSNVKKNKEERDRDKFDSMMGKNRNNNKYQQQQQQRDERPKDMQDVKVTGIGRKLLEKLGYKGTGDLRGDGTGIAEPIKAYSRPQGAGLSSSFKTDKQLQQKEQEQQDDEDEDDSDEDSEEEQVKATGWKKSDQTKTKAKYDIQEHIGKAKGGEDGGKGSSSTSYIPQVIVDMTGPTTMVRTTDKQSKKDIHSMANISLDDQLGPMSQLKYNIGLLIRMKGIDRQNINNKMKFENNRIESLTNSVSKLRLVIDSENAHRKKIETLKEILVNLQRQLDDGKLTLSTLFKQFIEFQTTYKKEYIKLKLYNLEKDFLRPLLIKKIELWNIEKDQNYLVDEMMRWRSIFDKTSLSIHGDDDNNGYDDDENDTRQKIMMNQGSDIYFILIRDLVLPVIKTFIRTRWRVKENTSVVVSLIGHWTAALPEVILDNILEQSIFPRIKNEVMQWNPLTDPIPIDQWLHPWIPFIKTDLESLYPQIRQTLISVLGGWDVADQSALALLSPWKGVFEGNSMDSLLNRSITPKFSKAFAAFQYDQVLVTSTTKLEDNENIYPIIEYFEEWYQLWSPQNMIHFLSKHFFPIFIESFCKSLQPTNTTNITPSQLLNFYQYWRQQFKSNIMDQNQIKYYFNIILDLIEQYLDKKEIKPKTNINILPTIINNNNNKQQQKQNNNNNNNNNKNVGSSMIEQLKNQINQNHSDGLLRDSLEQLAKELGLLFIPSNMSTDSGNQIYKFGSVPIVLDKVGIRTCQH